MTAFARRRQRRSYDWLAPLGAAAAAASVGGFIVLAPLAGILAVLLVAGVTIAAVGGRVLVAGCALSALPWLMVFDALLPPLVKTLAAAGAAAALLSLAAPFRIRGRAFQVGAALFLSAVLLATVVASRGEQFVQAAKFVIFAAVALAVLSTSARPSLLRLRRPVLASALAAITTHVIIIAAGLGEVGSYYGLGERLGFATGGQGPHEIALLGAIVVAGGLRTTSGEAVSRIALGVAGSVTVLATGVRSAALALVALFVAYLGRMRLSPRALALIAVLLSVVIASGALAPLLERFGKSSQTGEFDTFRTAGSGRGPIWEVSVNHWIDSGPFGWIFGTGLRSIKDLTEQVLGARFVGHSDVIEVGVQLGVCGLVGWTLIWLALFRSRLDRIVLVPIFVFGLVQGSVENTTALVFGLSVAAICAHSAEIPVPPTRSDP